MEVTLVDYGAGNLASVVKGFTAVGADVTLATRPADLASASTIVIPGVGHYAATRALDDDWRGLLQARLANGAVLLGICLGMQWLFEGSDESDAAPGFGRLAGRCRRLTPSRSGESSIKVPHVGWNTLEHTRKDEASSSRLLAGVPSGAYAYFTHLYAAPVTSATVATTWHGAPFASVVEQGRVFGTQWHPEKSGETGLRVLRNFLAVAGGGR